MVIKGMPLPNWLKQLLAMIGFLWAGLGLVVSCAPWAAAFVLTLEKESGAVGLSLLALIVFGLTVGSGGALCWHSLHSLAGRRSRPLVLPPVRSLAGLYALVIVGGSVGIRSDLGSVLLLPPSAVVGGTLLSLAAVSWISCRRFGQLTWRQGVIAFLGSAVISLVVVIVLEIILVGLLALFSPQPVERLVAGLAWLQDVVTGATVANATAIDLAVIVVQLALIVPLFGTLAKSLAPLPWLGRLSRREAFLMGSLAGAGYAAVESSILIGLGWRTWTVLLVLVVTGATIHPVGGGLVAVGWQQVLRRRAGAGLGWLARFGVALSLNSLWNFGLLVVLVGTETGPADINAGLVEPGYWVPVLLSLVFLVGLGLISSLAGRATALYLAGDVADRAREHAAVRFTFPDSGLAVWALASLAVIVPTGIVVLRLLN